MLEIIHKDVKRNSDLLSTQNDQLKKLAKELYEAGGPFVEGGDFDGLPSRCPFSRRLCLA
ncbi:MAG: hypothetical protein U0V54_10075 [Saprospiraceae bacterium]